MFDRAHGVFAQRYDAKDRAGLIQFPGGTVGNTVAWFPYATKFQEKHKCRLTRGMAEKMIQLFRDAYPRITSCPMKISRPSVIKNVGPSAATTPSGSSDQTGTIAMWPV
jgi:autotransporter strand-loop-strand O-heptosyltransferase